MMMTVLIVFAILFAIVGAFFVSVASVEPRNRQTVLLGLWSAAFCILAGLIAAFTAGRASL